MQAADLGVGVGVGLGLGLGVAPVQAADHDVAQVGADEEELVGVARPLHELDDRLEELARHTDGEGGEGALDDEERVDQLVEQVDVGAVALLRAKVVLHRGVVPLAEQLHEAQHLVRS